MRQLGLIIIVVLSFSIITHGDAFAYTLKPIVIHKVKIPTAKLVNKTDSLVKKDTKPLPVGKYSKPIIKKVGPASSKSQTMGKSPFITIELSNTCQSLIKRGLNSRCPSYSDLIQYDTTERKVSGDFINDTWFHRTKPTIINHDLMYTDSSKTIVCVDCSKNVMDKAKNIIIEARSFVYKLQVDHRTTNNTHIEYSLRFVDSCHDAHIAWDPWLLNDTINYLKSGCTKTEFKEKQVISKPYTQFDIKTTQAYKNKVWLEEAKRLSKTNCLKSSEC